jgi:nucleotide-binding universal stress UspA family protein
MYRTLLVPLDGSPLSEQALPAASNLAHRYKASLHLVHVHIPNDPIYIEGMPVIDAQLHSRGREHEHAYLEQIRARVAETGLNVTVANPTCDISVAQTLVEYAAAEEIDLIVMTTHGRGGLARFWLGSVADALVRWGAAPTLLMRPQEVAPADATAPAFQRILIPLDGSEPSEQILTHALALGRPFGAAYMLLRIVDAAGDNSIFGGAQSGAFAEHGEQQRHAAQQYLDGVAHRLQAAGVQTETHVVIARQPALAIIEGAHTYNATLIAMATHRRSGIARLLVGSVTDKVMRGATVPMLLYHPNEPSEGKR